MAAFEGSWDLSRREQTIAELLAMGRGDSAPAGRRRAGRPQRLHGRLRRFLPAPHGEVRHDSAADGGSQRQEPSAFGRQPALAISASLLDRRGARRSADRLAADPADVQPDQRRRRGRARLLAASSAERLGAASRAVAHPGERADVGRPSRPGRARGVTSRARRREPRLRGRRTWAGRYRRRRMPRRDRLRRNPAKRDAWAFSRFGGAGQRPSAARRGSADAFHSTRRAASNPRVIRSARPASGRCSSSSGSCGAKPARVRSRARGSALVENGGGLRGVEEAAVAITILERA